jgi:hypothetical protein
MYFKSPWACLDIGIWECGFGFEGLCLASLNLQEIFQNNPNVEFIVATQYLPMKQNLAKLSSFNESLNKS